MAHLYVYSPSGAVRDKAGFRRAVKRLQAQGHEVEIDPDALSSHQRFAGDDATRLAAIGRAAASGADLALISRGGYGLTRILPQIDWRAIGQATERGTRFVGFSDFTALQLGLLTQTGAVSWAGPALVEGFGLEEGVDEITQACFDDVLSGDSEGAGWVMTRREAQAWSMGQVAAADESGWQAHDAVLWGGNLALVTALIGTPYWPDVQGGVLFLEDVAEHPFRIERMLSQLLHAGVLARQQAVLLGQFTDFTPSKGHDRGFGMASVVRWLREQLAPAGVPVLTGLPFGHVPTKVLLPVGQRVTLNVEGRDVLLLWGH